MKRIAFGPMLGLPSTEWVGKDIALHIDTEYEDIDVELFHNFDFLPQVETIFIVKYLPHLDWLIKANNEKIDVVYFPVDYFHHPSVLERDAVKLKLLDGIVLHNERLNNSLPSSEVATFFVDHYLKYQLPVKRQFLNRNFVLWVGHIEYLPSLIETLASDKIPLPVKILTDLENLSDKQEYLEKEILKNTGVFNLEKKLDYVKLNGFLLEQWTSERQQNYMLSCRGAFDTKSMDFSHITKPPTKAQKYIFNAIPFATDAHTYAQEYFSKKGLELATLEQLERWLSEEYFNEINSFQEKYKETQTLAYISNEYLKIAEEVKCNRQKRNIGRSETYFLAVRNNYNRVKYFLSRVVEKFPVGRAT